MLAASVDDEQVSLQMFAFFIHSTCSIYDSKEPRLH